MRSSDTKVHRVNLYLVLVTWFASDMSGFTVRLWESTDHDVGRPHEVNEMFNTLTQNFIALEIISQLGAINICDLIAQVQSWHTEMQKWADRIICIPGEGEHSAILLTLT